MSLSDLSKEQKQYVVLGIIGVAVIGVLIFFGIKFALTSTSAARSELEEINGKIEAADRSLKKRSGMVAELDESTLRLGRYKEHAPPERNHYSWASEIIYDLARVAGVEVDAIDEEKSPSSNGENIAIGLEVYALRISAHAGYAEITGFIRTLQREQPLARIVGLDINKSNNPDSHDVQMKVQWPLYVGERTEVWDELMLKSRELVEAADTKVVDGSPENLSPDRPGVKSGQ